MIISIPERGDRIAQVVERLLSKTEKCQHYQKTKQNKN
jgi:hypothetical protein